MRQQVRRYATGFATRVAAFFSLPGRIADPVAKWATTIALIGGGVWAYYQFALGGASDWAVNLDISAGTIPYHDDLALLVVHVRSKNPRNSEVAVVLPIGATVWLTARLDYGGDYVSTSNIAVVAPRATTRNVASEVKAVLR